ncbi:MAG: V-type ATPase subunit [Candidatus Omnitrophota bacterium]
MSDYNYLNARIKALKKNLFPKGKMDELLSLHDFEAIKRFFLESPYKTSVSESLAQNPGEVGLEQGLSRHIHKTFQDILEWAGEEVQSLLEIFLRRYDLHNIKTLLRGKNGKVPAEAIFESLIPVGRFGPEELKELSRQPLLRDTLALLSDWYKPLKQVLRRGLVSLRQEPADLQPLEAELDRYYYKGMLDSLSEEETEDALLVKKYIQMELDMTNVLTVMRLGDVPRTTLSKYILEGGSLGKAFLFSISGKLRPAEWVQKFDVTYLAHAVRAWKFEEGLTDLERRFELSLLKDAQRMERADPLSVGVAISYCSLLSHELKRLRMILHGKRFVVDEARLREELLLV